MEPGRNPPRKGLTRFRSLQIITSPEAPQEVRSIDLMAPRGVPGRLSGFFGSEAPFIAYIHKTLLGPDQSLRFFTLYADGGDLQPHPKNSEELAQKKMVALDTYTSQFVRALVQKILDIPLERDSFIRLLTKKPELLNRLWEHELFANVKAFQWRCDVTLPNGACFPGMRLITLKDPSSILYVQCVDPCVRREDIRFVPYPAAQG
ncbi:MAG: hypothetical protein K6G15_11490 [Desulfovibrio sp.]|nr:hypothetical protein [Desulfovibrio sp.]